MAGEFRLATHVRGVCPAYGVIFGGPPGRSRVPFGRVTADLDHEPAELVEAATRLVAAHAKGDDHTVACAARDRDGRIITGLNVYHFTGGPCAELVTIGAAAAVGAYDLTTVVAAGNGGRGVLPPCGRCRQVLLDYFPRIEVVVRTENGLRTESGLRTVPVRELLPYAYEAAPDGPAPSHPRDAA